MSEKANCLPNEYNAIIIDTGIGGLTAGAYPTQPPQGITAEAVCPAAVSHWGS